MSEPIITQYFKSPVGELLVGSYQEQLCLCDWRYRKMRSSIDQRIQQGLATSYREGTSNSNQQCIQQLEEYFGFQRKHFDLNLRPVGTEFQQRVWQALMKVEFGQTSSYLKLAESLGNTKAVRAVATANGANAISVIIPCHRIIGSDGSLVGYAGGLRAKEQLLKLESDMFH